ncbi:MAG: exodeoxyribonuclease III [Candidatus Solincola sediminis]|uniref:Exodeoxyribonuclease III n=1 Tax=Candidatus Solincola sediminis TaxID=1797199 RepID=A0A1F2WHK9_9ACTN|nr:MAG: exodeoxyribonuclease III [Candidatus Solincola sediminis]OFW61695.1 MAG: exodeoxyribonuclease III [Candidatus Solincola sediminis]
MEKISICCWNVNGLRALIKKGSLGWFYKEKPHILCLQETKMTEEQLPDELKDIEGYKAYYCSPDKGGYSGVAQFTSLKPKSVKGGFGVARFDNEGRILISDYGKFVLFNIYFPNGKASPQRLRYKMEFYDAFLEYADDLKKKGRKIIACGDFNTAHKEIDIARPKENSKVSGFLPQEREWMDEFVEHGYLDTFRMFNQDPENYSWWDFKTRARERNVGWRIDYFFVSGDLKKNVKAASIRTDIMGSDHCPVGIDVVI